MCVERVLAAFHRAAPGGGWDREAARRALEDVLSPADRVTPETAAAILRARGVSAPPAPRGG